MTPEERHFDEKTALLSSIPPELQPRISYGLYGGIKQYFIYGVDGSLAQLGPNLPDNATLQRCVENADIENKKLRPKI